MGDSHPGENASLFHNRIENGETTDLCIYKFIASEWFDYVTLEST